MGSISAQKAWKVLRNVQTVLAIELLCACQGLDFARRLNSDRPLRSGNGVEAAFSAVRRQVKHLDKDRILYDDIQRALRLVLSGEVVASVERTLGTLD